MVCLCYELVGCCLLATVGKWLKFFCTLRSTKQQITAKEDEASVEDVKLKKKELLPHISVSSSSGDTFIEPRQGVATLDWPNSVNQ